MTLLAAVAAAQPSVWTDVRQLRAGTEVRVSLSGRTLRGSFESATADSLALRTGNGQEMLSRAQIGRVQTRRDSHRKRNALIGLGIGAGGGLAVGAGVDQSNHTSWFPNAGKEVLTPAGALIGTVIGVAVPSGAWKEIYRAP